MAPPRLRAQKQRRRVQLPSNFCSDIKFENVFRCCELPTILPANDFTICRQENEAWFQPPKKRPRQQAVKFSPRDNPLLKICMSNCVFQRNGFILSNGELNLTSILETLLRNQTSEDWKNVIAAGVEKCYAQMNNATKYLKIEPCRIENHMFLTCIRQYLSVNCSKDASAGATIYPTCEFNMQVLETCDPFIRDPRIDLYPPMRQRKKRTSTSPVYYYYNS
ncbi:Hypothetical predicted protein [Cloeon dipterum]|uniref:Uncharacterized protein n=1 Tax=Cloeon dipterum TaxID=197152 RepID=A0A8S1CV92_9INSE|nr:Hypothetical predicted protein [Cloeon dipterum]